MNAQPQAQAKPKPPPFRRTESFRLVKTLVNWLGDAIDHNDCPCLRCTEIRANFGRGVETGETES